MTSRPKLAAQRSHKARGDHDSYDLFAKIEPAAVVMDIGARDVERFATAARSQTLVAVAQQHHNGHAFDFLRTGLEFRPVLYFMRHAAHPVQPADEGLAGTIGEPVADGAP